MSVEQITNDPLELNLLGYSYDPEVKMDNTVGGWTPIRERAPLLYGLFSNRIEARRELFRSGYGLKEIAAAEQPAITKEAVRQTVIDTFRPQWVARLREVFPSQGSRWGMDDLVIVLSDFMCGLTQAEIARKYNFSPDRLYNKRNELKSAGFPMPDFPKSENPSWVTLQAGKEWITLSKVTRAVLGKSLRAFDLICPVLKSEGIRVELRVKRSKGKEMNCYYIPIAEKEVIEALHKLKPEIFISRTWSPRPAKVASMEYTNSHGLENGNG